MTVEPFRGTRCSCRPALSQTTTSFSDWDANSTSRLGDHRPRWRVLTVLFLVNTLGNLRGRHFLERWGFSAIAAVLAVLCAAIAVFR